VVVGRKWRLLGLAVGGGLGLLFGISQQLRGAHFLSHDVWTAGICWATALLTYLLFWHRASAPAQASVASSSTQATRSEVAVG
jgi:membrane-associated PAP2 superfamily phosphatase